MADQVAVETALAMLVADIVYPNGIAAPSISGTDVRVQVGWPNSRALDYDLSDVDAAGQPKNQVSNITVYSDPKLNLNTSRYQRTGYIVGLGQNTLDAVVTTEPTADGTGTTTYVTFAGSPDPGQVVSIAGAAFSTGYAAVAGDTLASIASALALVVPGAVAFGQVLAVNGIGLQVQVSALDTIVTRNRQVRGKFRVSFWCPDMATRAALVGPVDAVLSGLDWLALPNDVPAQMEWCGTVETDVSESSNLYRRDLLFDIDYETTSAPVFAPRMAFAIAAAPPPGGAGSGPLPPVLVGDASQPSAGAGPQGRGGLTITFTTPGGPIDVVEPGMPGSQPQITVLDNGSAAGAGNGTGDFDADFDLSDFS